MTARFVAAALLLACAAPLGAQSGALGRIEFPTTGEAAAQPHFIRGLLLLHSFEYEDAAIAFREAQRIDPDFAMAYWGEAMTYNHPIWMQQDSAAARAVLARLGATPGERAAKAGSAREREWLATVEILYGTGGKYERDLRYADAMRRLHESVPDDPEAAVFHALALLGTAHEGRDFATYMRAAAIADPVFRANPDHPGAAHYLIHAFDDPVHAPLGLPAARAYADIAPAASHAQHMTSHIFVAMGMWDDVVSANERARDVQDARNATLGRPPNLCGHYSSWLHYGYLQQGRVRAATALMDACHERVLAGAAPPELAYFAMMRARQVLDAGDPAGAQRWTADIPAASPARVTYDFITAFAALRQGDAAPARDIAEQLAQQSGETAQILALELRGALLAHDGDIEGAATALREAAAREEALPYEFGPPAIVKPTHELLGEVLLAAGRAGAARAAFAQALARTPRRIEALEGARLAAEATGDGAEANRLAAEVARIRAGADATASTREEGR